jgi:hypothetical protein
VLGAKVLGRVVTAGLAVVVFVVAVRGTAVVAGLGDGVAAGISSRVITGRPCTVVSPHASETTPTPTTTKTGPKAFPRAKDLEILKVGFPLFV